MQMQPIVSRDEWLNARTALLRREKELTRAQDELGRQRRALPWVRVDKPYVFDGPNGKVALADLFDGRSQLIVQHFMFGRAGRKAVSDAPSWPITWTPPASTWNIMT
jgi:predicted dithiol-disulfide oxidoreductase (DUF899 family)